MPASWERIKITEDQQRIREQLVEDDRFFKAFMWNVGVLRVKYVSLRIVAIVEFAVILALWIYR